MRSRDYYVTLYLADDFHAGADWHTQMHEAQILHNGDYFKNIATGINNHLNRHIPVKLSSHMEKTGGQTTEFYRDKGYYLVQLRLDEHQASGDRLRTPIRAGNITGVFSQGIFPEWKIRIFSQEPADSNTLQDDEIALYEDFGVIHYMLRGDEVGTPIHDLSGNPEYYAFAGAQRLSHEASHSAIKRLLNSKTAGATAEGRPVDYRGSRVGTVVRAGLMSFLGAIAKDGRIKKHGAINLDLPIVLTREDDAADEVQDIRHGQGLFVPLPAVEGNPKDKDKAKAPEEVKNQNIELDFEAFYCPITQERMIEPVICTLDGSSYEKAAIEEWLTKSRTSPMNREPIPNGKDVKDILIPNHALKAAITTGELEKFNEPVLCTRDGITYEKSDVIAREQPEHLIPNRTLQAAIDESLVKGEQQPKL